MTHLEPLRREDLPELESLFQLYDDTLSFVPNSLYTMARRPEILRALSALITAVWRSGTLEMSLKPLLAMVASRAAGCQYCQAHEAVDARMRGVVEEKIAAVWDFETSPLFSERERSALRFAAAAATMPNQVSAELMGQVRQHFSEGEIVELLAVVSLFGFLNRWNDSLATELEAVPTRLAERTLAPQGWEPGKHGRRDRP